MLLKKNVGNLDSTIRVAIGSLLLIAGIWFDSWWGLVGLIPIVTGTIAWCPLYRIFGIDTCEVKVEREN
jgi:hypothetical protein